MTSCVYGDIIMIKIYVVSYILPLFEEATTQKFCQRKAFFLLADVNLHCVKKVPIPSYFVRISRIRTGITPNTDISHAVILIDLPILEEQLKMLG